MLIAALLMLVFLLLQADTTTVPAAVGIGGFVIGYILKNIVPLVSSFAFKWWNTKAGSWYALQSNAIKMAVYVVATVVFMFLFSIAGLGWDATTDPSNLTPEFFQNLVMAFISTFLVKVGIRQEQAKQGLAKSGAKSHTH